VFRSFDATKMNSCGRLPALLTRSYNSLGQPRQIPSVSSTHIVSVRTFLDEKNWHKPAKNSGGGEVKKVDPNENPTLLGHVEAPVVSLSNRFALYKFSKKKGKYKSMADVPNFVSRGELDSARSRMRIFLNLCIAFGSLAIAIVTIIREKRHRAAGGATWVEQNMAKHHRYQQEHKAKEKVQEEEEERAST